MPNILMRRWMIAIIAAIAVGCGASPEPPPTPSPISEPLTPTSADPRRPTATSIYTNTPLPSYTPGPSPTSTATRTPRPTPPPTATLTPTSTLPPSIPYQPLIKNPALPPNAIAQLGAGHGRAVEVSPTQNIVVASTTTGLYMFQLPTMEKIWSLRLADAIDDIIWSPDGTRFITIPDIASTLSPALWDVTGTQITTLSLVNEQAIWSPDSQYLLLASGLQGSEDGPPSTSLTVLNGRDGTRVRSWDIPTYYGEGPELFGFSPDSTRVMVQTFGEVVVLDVRTGEEVTSLEGVYYETPPFVFGPPNDVLTTSTEGDDLLLTSILTGDIVLRVDLGLDGQQRQIMPTASGQSFTVWVDGQTIEVDFVTGETLPASDMSSPYRNNHKQLSSDGNYVVHIHREDYYVTSHVAVWGKRERAIVGGISFVPPIYDSLTYTQVFDYMWLRADGETVALAPFDPNDFPIQTWNFVTGAFTEDPQLTPPSSILTLGRDGYHGPFLGVQADDGDIHFTIQAEQPIRYPDNDNYAHAYDLSSDGRRLAVGTIGDAVCAEGPLTAACFNRKGRITVYDVQTGEVIVRREFGRGIYALKWSPDGQTLAVGISAGFPSVRENDIYLLSPGLNRIGTLRGHTDIVYGLEWSAGSTRLISLSADGTVVVWEVP